MEGSELSGQIDQWAKDNAEEHAKVEQEMADGRNGNPLWFKPFAVGGDFNPREIETRDWLSVGLLLCCHVTLLISPGGVGKSTLAMLIAVAVALGRKDLIPGRDVTKSGNVLVVNSEDDLSEMKRRLAGILTGHEIDADELTGKLHIESLYGRSGLLAASDEGGGISDGNLFKQLVEFCNENNIKLIVIDPLVGFHDANENDNGVMEKVATTLRRVARSTGAAVLAIHHTRKGQGSETHAGDMDAGRGASALTAAARIAITVARMTKETAKKLNLDWQVGKHLRRIDDAKQNYAPPAETVSWFEMRDTRIANGERVGVPVSFDMSEITTRAAAVKDQERENAQILQRIKTAKVIVGDTSEGSKHQPEVVDLYEQATGLKRSAVQDHIRKLPIGKENAFRFTSDTERSLLIWRNNVGTDQQPRYQIEWSNKM
jgi:RecA-family ATPase